MNFTKTSIPLTYILGFLCAVLSSVSAQQAPTFSEYNYNPFIINPACAGLTESTEISISNAGFFNSFEGSPRSFALSAHGSVNRKKVGLGAGIIRDEIGVTTATHFFAAYAYKIYFDLQGQRPYWQNYVPGVLSFGVTAGVQQYQDNLLDLGIMGDQSFAQNVNATIPMVGLGILFNHDTFYIGISTPNIIGNALSSEENLNLSNPYFGYFGYRFYNTIFEELMIKPNVLLKYENGAPLQADFNVAISFKNKFELGTGYRTSNSINFLAGFYVLKNMRAIYNYNLAINDSPLGSTHGLILSYQFGNGYQKR